LLHFLQFLGLFLHRHDQTTVSPSKTSLTTLRDGNRRRAKGWREDAGSLSYPESLISAFASEAAERCYVEKEQAQKPDQDGDVAMEDILDRSHETQPRLGANGVAKHYTDTQDETQPETVTLLDILPSFIHLSATRMAMGSMIHEPESTPDTYDDDIIPSDDAASTDTLSWATEPQWLRLAASFMLQTILERYLDPHLPLPNSPSHVLEAFSWGYITTSSASASSGPHNSSKADPTRHRTDKSLTIPDSDEGDITVLGTTPASSPTTLPPSHSNIFVLRTETTPDEAGSAWGALRLQAMSLLIPDDNTVSLRDRLMKVQMHHPVDAFEKDLFGFLTGLLYSVEEPVLGQLERVWPAWVAARDRGVEEEESDMVKVEDGDRSGWLEAAGEKVTVGGNELGEKEVEALMHLVEEWWS